MAGGFVRDVTQGATLQSQWVEGEADTWKVLGLSMGTLSMSHRVRLPIITYRCTRCGYLESYAPALNSDENVLLRPAASSDVDDEAKLLRPAGDGRE